MALVDQIIGIESGGNPNATNPRSSASGLGQFLNSTWLSTIKQHRPDLAQGMSDPDLLALKSDPQLSREMTAAYAADNGSILSRAGLPVTPETTYLAHFAGPQGAVKVLQADPSAPVGSILGAGAVSANPFLRGMTAADLQAWASRKMGGGAAAPKLASAAPVSQIQDTSQQALSFAPQQTAPPQQDGSIMGQMAMQPIQAPPINYVQRKPPDLRALKQAFNNPLFGGFFNARS